MLQSVIALFFSEVMYVVNIEKIKNIENADSVRQKINKNFDVLSEHFSSRVLSLSQTEMDNIGQDCVREGLIVYNTSNKKWYKRAGNVWESYKFYNTFASVFSASDWVDGKIIIPYSVHLVDVKNVCVYMATSSGYKSVQVGVVIDSYQNIVIESDITFSGRVTLS